MHGGHLDNHHILEEKTIASIFSEEHFGRGLCWNATTLSGNSSPIWYHSGSDPGVVTFMGFRPQDQAGVIVMANCDDPGPGFQQIVRSAFA